MQPLPKDMSVTPWCQRAIEAARRVQQGWALRLHEALGSKLRAGWCAEGLKDAVERLRHKNSAYYEWMEIIPLIHRFHTSPTFSFTYNKHQKEYRHWVEICMGHVDEQRARLASLPPVPIRKKRKPKAPPTTAAEAGGGSKDGAAPALPLPSSGPKSGDESEFEVDPKTGLVKYTNPVDGWMKKKSMSSLWVQYLMHYSPSLDIICEMIQKFQVGAC